MSLQDQMLKAGLISEQQLEKVRDPEPRYKPRQGQAGKSGQDGRRGGRGGRPGSGTQSRRRSAGQGSAGQGGAGQGGAGQGGGGRGAGGGRRGAGQRGAGPAAGPGATAGGGAAAGGNAGGGAGDGAAGGAPRKRRRRGGRGSHASAPAPVAPTVDVQKLRSDQQRSRELLRDTRLAGESAQARRKREARMKLEALLADLRQNEPGAEIAFYFTRGKRVRRAMVSEAQRHQIVSGELVLAAVGADVHIVAAQAKSQIGELAPDAYFHSGASEAAPRSAADSDYEGFEVPDDLVW